MGVWAPYTPGIRIRCLFSTRCGAHTRRGAYREFRSIFIYRYNVGSGLGLPDLHPQITKGKTRIAHGPVTMQQQGALVPARPSFVPLFAKATAKASAKASGKATGCYYLQSSQDGVSLPLICPLNTMNASCRKPKEEAPILRTPLCRTLHFC